MNPSVTNKTAYEAVQNSRIDIPIQPDYSEVDDEIDSKINHFSVSIQATRISQITI